MQTENEDQKANEPQVGYSNRIVVSTFDDLEERDRELAHNRSHNERMEYLQKLIHITYSDADLITIEKKFYNGKIQIRKAE